MCAVVIHAFMVGWQVATLTCLSWYKDMGAYDPGGEENRAVVVDRGMTQMTEIERGY